MMPVTRSQDKEADPSPAPLQTSKSANLIYKSGDVLKATEEYIVHQCNCVTTTTAGLATAISKQFPFANPYSNRRPDPNRPSRCQQEDAAKPGTRQIWRSEDGKGPAFIGLYAQYGPGRPSNKDHDTAKDREEWFKKCLELIDEVKGVKSIALPWQIGCGLAGGRWATYEKIIKDWAETHPDVFVSIYKLEDAGHSSRGRGRGRGSRGGAG